MCDPALWSDHEVAGYLPCTVCHFEKTHGVKELCVTKAAPLKNCCFLNWIDVQVIHERVGDSICSDGYTAIVLK